MRSPFSFETKFVIGACAIIDAAAALVLADGANTVRMCGVGWVLVGLEFAVVFSFGAIPAVIALAAVGVATLIPELRSRTVWVVSASSLLVLAVGSVAAAAHPFPVPSDFLACTL